MNSQKFQAEYKRLNSKQKQAVDAIDGPVMVVAGPGTGKTQILTLRIANILHKTDTDADSILALTFTESGAYSMRKRLVEIIGSTAYKVTISTFHGFCNDVIKNYPEEFPEILSSTNVSDIDQIRLIEEIIETTELKKLKPYGDTFYYVRPILSQIRDLKREDIDPVALSVIVKKQQADFEAISDLYYDKGPYKGKMKGVYGDLLKNIEKNQELCIVYKMYQKSLRKGKLYDYEDMIMETIKVLRDNGDLLLRLQEKYQYILADEHQDANNAQNKILELLCNFHESPNLFIVGDEKQAIFRFQGASLDNFLYFKKIYPHAKLIALLENYRSTQTILDASHSLILKNTDVEKSLRTKLIARTGSDIHPKIFLYEFSKPDFEFRFLVKDIRAKIAGGISPSHIAILYRDNKDMFPIAHALEKTEIPFAIESDQDVFSDEDISKLILLLRGLSNLADNTLLSKILFIDFLGINNLDVYKILHYSSRKRLAIFDVLRNRNLLSELALEDADKLHASYQKMLHWNRLSKNKNLADFFELIVRESGFLEHVIGLSGSYEKLEKLDIILSEIKKIVVNHKDYHLDDFIRYLDVLKEHNVLVKVKSGETMKESVRLMTAHKSKGLEFDYVYIAGCFDTHWGNKKGKSYFHVPLGETPFAIPHSIDDERRLFYVALTRARKQVIVSYSKEGINGESQLPAQFVEEIDKDHVEKIDSQDVERELGETKSSVFDPQLQFGIDLKDKAYLSKIFLEQGLSVTALNNYLSCPWNYFFTNLVRLPQSESKHQLYGTAVHETLKEFFDKYKIEEDITKKTLLSLFESFLKKKPLNQADFEESLAKGERALGGYYDFYKGTWTRNIVNEYDIAGVFVDLPEESGNIDQKILLKGKLDKIELQEDTTVNVVDYKTGKPKSRNEIEGKTKSSNGEYKRQLAFYKLLLDKQEKSVYSMLSGEIDFIEPDEKGRYKKERFVVTEDEVKELVDVIKKVSEEIISFSFWEKKCQDKKCEFCKMSRILK